MRMRTVTFLQPVYASSLYEKPACWFHSIEKGEVLASCNSLNNFTLNWFVDEAEVDVNVQALKTFNFVVFEESDGAAETTFLEELVTCFFR
jgi:hypothetical protein